CLRQALAEQPCGHSNHQAFVVSPLLPRGAKPGGETMGIDAPFGVLEDFVPKIHGKNQSLLQFPLMWKCCGNPLSLREGRLSGLSFQARCAGSHPACATTHEIWRSIVIPSNARAGILPKRSAMSKRKLCESSACPPQTIHSFSTALFSCGSRAQIVY